MEKQRVVERDAESDEEEYSLDRSTDYEEDTDESDVESDIDDELSYESDEDEVTANRDINDEGSDDDVGDDITAKLLKPIDDDQLSITSGGIFSETASLLLSKDPKDVSNIDNAALASKSINLSYIRNKKRKCALYEKLKREQNQEKQKLRKQRKLLREKLGDAAPPLKPPKTLENTREKDDTMVQPDDQEVLLDLETDEMAEYFTEKRTPRILVTTSDVARSRTRRFVKEFSQSLPNSIVRSRKYLAVKKIIPQCIAKGYTDLIIVNEDRKTPNGLLLCHLPNGPTAHFKLSNVKLRREIPNCGRPTKHKPEIILNNFGTRLGHSIGRMLAALYPHEPQFRGRQVATYHNQRDFVFFRHHRYVFRNNKRVALQEVGPRFTLKLRSLQNGTFDSKFGEYEWLHKRHEMDTTRRRFHL